MRRHCRWVHAPVIHAASHFYHDKRDKWVSISMHACDPVPIVMGLRLAALLLPGALLLEKLSLMFTANGGNIREFEPDVYRRWQTVNITSLFLFFSCYP